MSKDIKINSNGTTVNFRFGDPEAITAPKLSDVLGVFYDDHRDYYTPPILPSGLSSLTRANGIHRRCINFKVNQMAICFKKGPVTLRDFRRAAQDQETFGNHYLENIFNFGGQISRCVHLPALNMRKGKNDTFKMLKPGNESTTWDAGEVLHGLSYDTGQSIYGLPSWIGCLNDVFLNSEATLFRRRYYKNGSHLGYILYTNLDDLDTELEEKIAQAVENSKGIGNFKSMYINSPKGGEKAVQIIPVGDISQKDEYEKIKNISADDMIVSHGIIPQLAAMKPDNVGGFGDIEKTGKWFRENEVRALVQPFLELNEFLPSRLHFEFDFEI